MSIRIVLKGQRQCIGMHQCRPGLTEAVETAFDLTVWYTARCERKLVRMVESAGDRYAIAGL